MVEAFHYEWEKDSTLTRSNELEFLEKPQLLNKTRSILDDLKKMMSMPEAPIPEMTLWDLLKVDSSYFTWAFDSNKGQFKDGVEKLDKNWRYLEISGKKIYNLGYSNVGTGIYYEFWKNNVWNYTIRFGQWENGELKWRWTSINLVWSKLVGQRENGTLREWEWITVDGWEKKVRQIRDYKPVSCIVYDKHGRVIK